MREILFRGKTLTGRWVEGSYYKQEEFYGSKENADVIITSKESLTYDQALEFAIVLPETLGQYTGLTDKNGKKIFEGDIIAYKYKPTFDTEVVGYYKVEYNENLGVYEPFGDSDCAIEADEIEVVGNVFDNPELLEVK